MYTISPEVYDELADEFLARIGDGSYCSGVVELLSGDIRISMCATLIIYRRSDERPERVWQRIVDVVPVWWECRTVYGSTELLNDFDFREFADRLINSHA